ncbi:hypothetical protein RhiirA5_430501 [Rhizophagus irregularis]|uniref:Uncharacterized protein n=1 Tax=Rhizophagus irregularis TaxID=588596 RepID=A0A2N0NWL3_9GLOM|nr:hypothetical protein RhiirA5_430501 [Rhizophagus irregularis]
MNSRQIFFALLIVFMAAIVTASSPLNLYQLTKRGIAQKDKSPLKEKNGKVKAALILPSRGEPDDI